MLKIAHHPFFCHPLPEGHRFPMLKYELIPQQLIRRGIAREENFFEPEILNEEIVLLTHSNEYWNKLKSLSLSYHEERRIGFPLSERLVKRELRICRGTIDSALYAIDYGVSFNSAGGTHHAGSDWGEGFCLLNDQAIAANYLIDSQISNSILIIDLDVHQGNGTAEIFADNDAVFTFSIHGEKNFPFRKEKSDLDVASPDGIEDEEYQDILVENLEKAICLSSPDMIFYQAGVDVLSTDKLGKLSLSPDGCKKRDYIVLNKCKALGLPVQISMGGGYSAHIKDIVDAHCNTYLIANELFF
ncbi:Histone deacetylase [Pseudopedobacter saltans DSM 12145]|uniref:Histone deacetylase n=1 Tax=Pseudopedobacter saltans (strain ATCC 51119 / DSM 12145 / JCM 21818 / CCUG 39354 / LMG 10337 / NBRC 100064 / NCIMB 13643) TaxID=762903 RepID=F0SAZ6_PSESL|nr:histone deacetylase [Pseudopedobacter saltans]ADY51591.1 Histone deacetylase [Pseudopedobacter saltans DSM 12145]